MIVFPTSSPVDSAGRCAARVPGDQNVSAERIKRSVRGNEHHGPPGHEQKLFGKGVPRRSGYGRRVLTQDAQIGKPRVLRHESRSYTIETTPFHLKAVLPLDVFERGSQSRHRLIDGLPNPADHAGDRSADPCPSSATLCSWS